MFGIPLFLLRLDASQNSTESLVLDDCSLFHTVVPGKRPPWQLLALETQRHGAFPRLVDINQVSPCRP